MGKKKPGVWVRSCKLNSPDFCPMHTGALAQHFFVHIRNGPPDGTVEEIFEFLQRAAPLNVHKMPPQPNSDATLFIAELLGEYARVFVQGHW